ncbi:MAG TPA: MOSC domain-containing protein [Dehalococcoidia bacterium]|jgi:MOSC domain-containing protein YiiM|nr:MOSC domain-containing protein [SAR202 cluster bacterium]HAC19822.1 MOSC domain-containing protein [Dehalococcoidia bacterium]HBD84471.1 MOSC domain-containing protein [Dehalococcoidia bacterium]HIM16461.1 MOSC domain-containing protein [Dehalococcoidia bacterium]HIM91249.1 MOSC domain-containing protein [Dehalococcoidia bacterium]|tara:strand:+ start:14432 stop:14881 length:450 start_codon:yes stop_codon:yes gene_type:complete
MVAEIISLQICVGHREPMNPVDSATFIEGFGIEGDRHAVKSGARTVRQVLLMDEDTLEGFGLGIGQVRENVTVRGIDLHEVPAGQRLALGDDVVVEITQFCAPCERMEEVRPGLREELFEQRGMLATVISGGAVNVGDQVQVVESASVS